MSPRSLARVASSFDGLERLSRQTLMDILDVCRSANAQPGTYRHLATFQQVYLSAHDMGLQTLSGNGICHQFAQTKFVERSDGG